MLAFQYVLFIAIVLFVIYSVFKRKRYTYNLKEFNHQYILLKDLKEKGEYPSKYIATIEETIKEFIIFLEKNDYTTTLLEDKFGILLIKIDDINTKYKITSKTTDHAITQTLDYIVKYYSITEPIKKYLNQNI